MTTITVDRCDLDKLRRQLDEAAREAHGPAAVVGTLIAAVAWLDVLLTEPPRCSACGAVVDEGTTYCETCSKADAWEREAAAITGKF